MGLFSLGRKKKQEPEEIIPWRERLRDQDFYVRRMISISTAAEEELWGTQPAPVAPRPPASGRTGDAHTGKR